MRVDEILNEGKGPKINHIDIVVRLQDLEEHEINSVYSNVTKQLKPALGKDSEGSGIMLKLNQTEPSSEIEFSVYGDERVFTVDAIKNIGRDFIAVLSKILNRQVGSNEYEASFQQFDSSKYPYMVSMEM